MDAEAGERLQEEGWGVMLQEEREKSVADAD